MNKNMHEIALTTSINSPGENYVARRQAGYRHESNRAMHLEHECRSFHVRAKRSDSQMDGWVCPNVTARAELVM